MQPSPRVRLSTLWCFVALLPLIAVTVLPVQPAAGAPGATAIEITITPCPTETPTPGLTPTPTSEPCGATGPTWTPIPTATETATASATSSATATATASPTATRVPTSDCGYLSGIEEWVGTYSFSYAKSG